MPVPPTLKGVGFLASKSLSLFRSLFVSISYYDESDRTVRGVCQGFIVPVAIVTDSSTSENVFLAEFASTAMSSRR